MFTFRIGKATHELLEILAAHTGQTMTDLLDQALQDYRRKVFFDNLNAGYAALRADKQEWKKELAERRQWDRTLADGLDPEEHWTEDGRVSPKRMRRKKKG